MHAYATELQQNAKIKWLINYEWSAQNFFYARINANKRRPTLSQIINKNGKKVNYVDDIKQAVISYFSELYNYLKQSQT